MAAPTITDSVSATGTGTSLTTGNLVIGSGEYLYVCVVLSDGSPGGMTSVTSSGGGGALSSISDSGVRESFLRQHWWRSTSPTAGTVTITATPAASTGEIGILAFSISGVDSGTPNGSLVYANGNGTADAVSGTVSSGTDAIVIDAIGRFQNAALSVTGGQTQLEQANQGGILQVGSSWEAGAATVTTGWGVNAAGTVSNWQWVIGALSINGATGGGGGPSITSVTPSTFSPGDTVTVTGSGFGATQGSSTLDVGGEAQTVTSWSDTSVQFRATRGALAYDAYTLTLTNGTSDTYSVTLVPPVGWASYTIGTPAGSGLLPFTPDLGSGDQMALQTVGGLVAGATDGTFSVAGQGYVAFAYEGWSSGSGWGALNTYVVFAQAEANTGTGAKGGAFGFTGRFFTARRKGARGWRLLRRRPDAGGSSAAGWQVQADWLFQNPNASVPTNVTASLGIAIQAAQSATASVALAVQTQGAATASLAAVVQVAQAATASASVAVQASASATASLATAVQAPQSTTASVATVVQVGRTATAAFDAALQEARSATASLDLQILAGSQVAASLSAAIQAPASTSASLAAAVQFATSASASVAAAVQEARSASASLGAAVQAQGSASASLAAYVQAGTSVAASLAAAVQEAKTATASLAAAVAVARTASASVAAAIATQQTVTASMQAAVQAARSASASASLYVDAGDVIETYPLAGESQLYPLAGEAQTYPLQ